MGASLTTCRVHIAQLRGITKLSPLLVRLEACALRKRGLECPSVGIQPPNPTPLFGKYLTKPIRFTTSLPAQCYAARSYAARKIKSIDLPLFVMDYGIRHSVLRAARLHAGAIPRLYNAFEQFFKGGLLN